MNLDNFQNKVRRLLSIMMTDFTSERSLRKKSDKTATIAFMRSWGDRNSFKWPETIEIDTVDAKFVFAWDLKMFSTNRRTWCVHDFDALVATYKNFQSA